jgi:pyruvate kinase
MSFVRNKEHIQELRDILIEHHANKEIGIISKVENQEGLDHIEDIVEYSDGIMVARGDLGIEVDISSIPVRQRKIVKLCRSKGKFVIVATQLIESMMEVPFPTRAEVSDIFNAVMQKADAVMTS